MRQAGMCNVTNIFVPLSRSLYKIILHKLHILVTTHYAKLTDFSIAISVLSLFIVKINVLGKERNTKTKYA